MLVRNRLVALGLLDIEQEILLHTQFFLRLSVLQDLQDNLQVDYPQVVVAEVVLLHFVLLQMVHQTFHRHYILQRQITALR